MSIILPIITEYMDGGVKKAQRSLKDLASSHLTTTAAVGTLVAIGRSAVKAYNDDAKSQRLLALTLRNTTQATDAQVASTEEYLSRLSRQVAVADDELRPSLGNLLRITKDQRVAQDLLNDSLDIAAATGRPLESVTLAVGKAYQGNFKALKSMGLSISDATIKSKNFNSAMMEIRPTINNAAVEAANGADGGFAKLTIAVDEVKESLGKVIAEGAAPWVRALADVTTATQDSEGATSFLKGAIMDTLGIRHTTKVWGWLTGKLKENQEQADKTAAANANAFNFMDKLLFGPLDTLNQMAEALRVQQLEADKARAKLLDLAKTTKGKLATAMDNAKQKVQDLKNESANLASTIRDQVTGFVSLSDAVSTSTDAEDTYNQALKDRADAYAKLNKLEAERQRRGFGPNDQVTYDAQQYAEALIDVASAEAAVSSAQSKRVNYSEKFAADIAAASQFAGKLKTLAERGLGQAGIQQLLNLGPVAGNQVATDLINGTGPMTVDTLRSSLAGLESMGQGLGDVTATGVFGTAITGAQSEVDRLKQARVVTTNNNVTIEVKSTDPDAVVAALKKWMKTNGSIPIRVTGK